MHAPIPQVVQALAHENPLVLPKQLSYQAANNRRYIRSKVMLDWPDLTEFHDKEWVA